MAALGGGTGIREVRDVAGSEQLCKEKKKDSSVFLTVIKEHLLFIFLLCK